MAKKTTKKKAAKALKKAKKYTKEQGVEDRSRAKELGLSLIHFRVLRGLQKADGKEGLTYRQIERVTGYYSPLAGILHTDTENGLVPRRLANRAVQNLNDRDYASFAISPLGQKLLARKTPITKATEPTKKTTPKKATKKATKKTTKKTTKKAKKSPKKTTKAKVTEAKATEAKENVIPPTTSESTA